MKPETTWSIEYHDKDGWADGESDLSSYPVALATATQRLRGSAVYTHAEIKRVRKDCGVRVTLVAEVENL